MTGITKQRWERCERLFELAYKFEPIPLRQLMYKLTHFYKEYPKDDNTYKTCMEDVGQLRFGLENPNTGEILKIGWDQIPDLGRNKYQAGFDSAEEAEETFRQMFFIRPYKFLDYDIQVWVEANGFVDDIREFIDPYGIPIIECHGSPSQPQRQKYLSQCSETRKTIIYVFSDYDMKGLEIEKNICDSVYGYNYYKNGKFIQYRPPFPPNPDLVTVKRVAVTEEQIKNWDLPTAFVKKTVTKTGRVIVQETPLGRSFEIDGLEKWMLEEIIKETILKDFTDDMIDEAQKETEKYFVSVSEWSLDDYDD